MLNDTGFIISYDWKIFYKNSGLWFNKNLVTDSTSIKNTKMKKIKFSDLEIVTSMLILVVYNIGAKKTEK